MTTGNISPPLRIRGGVVCLLFARFHRFRFDVSLDRMARPNFFHSVALFFDSFPSSRSIGKEWRKFLTKQSPSKNPRLLGFIVVVSRFISSISKNKPRQKEPTKEPPLLVKFF
jgi:hypothetical protein